MPLTSRRALNINLYTTIAVYFLILVGGIVRSMGAGMGCPDWPKCFGVVIPPGSEAELPDNYREIYVESRIKKNERLAKTLTFFGADGLAAQVSNDPTVQRTTDFDPQKAWIEYANRLVGVVIGILITINMVLSLRYWNKARRISILGVAAFVLVLFEGWIGSLVVSTNLLPGFISLHMMLALLLVGVLIYQRFQMKEGRGYRTEGGLVWLAALVLFLVQIVLGIEVRESIDIVKSTTDLARSSWIMELGNVFYIHRSYSILLMLLVFYLAYINYRSKSMSLSIKGLLVVVFLEVAFGVVLTYLGFPAFAQPVHLVLATIAVGLIFYLFLCSNLKVKRR